MYPEKFDKSKLTEKDKAILENFTARRIMFDKFIEVSNLKLFTCPGCGFPTLVVRGEHDICSVCDWEDDNQDDESADEIWGGPNGSLSLTENRLNIGKTLKELAEILNGKVNENPNEVILILSNHSIRMQVAAKQISETTDISDNIYIEYYNEKGKILNALIKPQ